jgi:hypothetical protein
MSNGKRRLFVIFFLFMSVKGGEKEEEYLLSEVKSITSSLQQPAPMMCRYYTVSESSVGSIATLGIQVFKGMNQVIQERASVKGKREYIKNEQTKGSYE